MASLRRVLASVEHIHTGDNFVAKIQQSKRRKSLVSKKEPQCAPEAMGAFARAHSVEHFLRYQSKKSTPASLQQSIEQDQEALTTFNQASSFAARPSLSISPSVENLLKAWSTEKLLGGPPGTPARINEESALVALKHLELSSWFSISKPRKELCRDIRQIHRGNIEEWILSYWFDGAESIEDEDLTAEEIDEARELTDEVIRWAGLPLEGSLQKQRRNPRLTCFRLRNDPLPAVHRPLFVYAATSFVLPSLGDRVLSWLGFRPYRSGSMKYWFRPPHASAFHKSGRPRLQSGDPDPLVFIHGIGIGPSMCLPFLKRLVRHVGSESQIFVVDIAAISMRFVDDAPGSTEITSNIVNMLQVWGFSRAHFVAHSFGNFVLAWMLRYQRETVERATCIDPICFLALRSFKELFELQQLRWDHAMNTMELLIKYFVLTELFVCNFCCRCFFWEESQLDMRDLEGIPVLVILESDDLIVQVHSVRRLVLAEQQRRARHARTLDGASSLELLWIDGQPHAGFLGDSEANKEIGLAVRSFHCRTRT